MSWNLFPKRVSLIPKDISFFAMFAEMSNNLDRWSQRFGRFVRRLPRGLGKIKEIRRIEHVGDDLTHSILLSSIRHSLRRSTAKTFTSLPRRSTTFST